MSQICLQGNKLKFKEEKVELKLHRYTSKMLPGYQKIPHRRVMNSVSNPGLSNPQHYAKNSVGYGNSVHKEYFGTDRKQLADFVMQELNQNHKNDADILQKFRRQAQQSKQRRFRLKRGQSNYNYYRTPQPKRQKILIPQPFKQQYLQQNFPKNQQLANFSNIPLTQSRHQTPQKRNQYNYQMTPSQPQVVIIREPQPYQSNGKQDYLLMQNQKLRKKLKQRNEALKNAKKKIHKCQMLLSQVKNQQDHDEQQRTVGKMNKVANLIDEMCSKIQHNGALLNNSLLQLNEVHRKQEQSKFQRSPIPTRKRTNGQIITQRKDQYIPSIFQSKVPSVHYQEASLARQTKTRRPLENSRIPYSNGLQKSRRHKLQEVYDRIQKIKESRNRIEAYNFMQEQY